MIAPIRILTLFPSTAWHDPCPFLFSGSPLTRDGQDSKDPGRDRSWKDTGRWRRIHKHFPSCIFAFSGFPHVFAFRISAFFALSHFCLGYAYLSFFFLIQMHSSFGLWHVDFGLQEDSIWRFPYFPYTSSHHFHQFHTLPDHPMLPCAQDTSYSKSVPPICYLHCIRTLSHASASHPFPSRTIIIRCVFEQGIVLLCVRPHSAPLPCPIRPHHFRIQSFHFRTHHHHHSIHTID